MTDSHALIRNWTETYAKYLTFWYNFIQNFITPEWVCHHKVHTACLFGLFLFLVWKKVVQTSPSILTTALSVTGACFSPLPELIGAFSIWELAANNWSSWISQACSVHFARQLLTECLLLVTFVISRMLGREMRYNRGRGVELDRAFTVLVMR